MQTIRSYFLPSAALGGVALACLTGIYTLASGSIDREGGAAIALLLLATGSLAAALGLQGLKYRRQSRYAEALHEILCIVELAGARSPETLTGAQATAICDRIVDGLARVFTYLSGESCHVSIEVLTPKREGVHLSPRPDSAEYAVVNLSRDASADRLGRDGRRHSIAGNSAYCELSERPDCSAYYFRPDAAADPEHRSTEAFLDTSAESRTLSRPSRSILAVKICRFERCREEGEHVPVGFLWLRSAKPNVLDERYDIELMQRIARALSPVVTRCAQATKPTHDFRRQPGGALPMLGPTRA
jgi:hypothetical protein